MSLFLYSIFLAQADSPWTPVPVSLLCHFLHICSNDYLLGLVRSGSPPQALEEVAGRDELELIKPSPSSLVSWVLFFEMRLPLYHAPYSEEITRWYLLQHSSQGSKICPWALLIMRRVSLTTLKGPEFYTNDIVFVLMIVSGPHSHRGDGKQPQGMTENSKEEQWDLGNEITCSF